MRIQNILLPKIGICTQEDMFFRRENGYWRELELHMENDSLLFRKNGRGVFDTYFNGLSIAKWKKYTNIKDVTLTVALSGTFEVILTCTERINNHISVKIINQDVISCKEKTFFSFPYNLYEYKGMLAFELKALEEDSVFWGGWYEADIEPEHIHDVNIAINICTFKREPFILRNLDILKKYILENPDNDLSGHLQVFISDNGQTLPREELNTKVIHIVSNKNVGGAGGFTRGLMEILKSKDTYPATHTLMMDDDIIIEPESIFRTYTFLRCRKEKYDDMFVGGAMLKMDSQNIQVESGASWNEGELVSNKHGLNLSSLDACLYNEEEEYVEYNAWWYCCTPMHIVDPDNLPLPIFIRGDDLEYGLRNMKTLVLLNGICVWHEAFEHKYSSFLQYYILRNLLYDNSLHFPEYSVFSFLKRLYAMVIRELFYYRYKNVDLIFRGVNDFFKGVEFLKNTDGAKLHQEIMAAGYKALPTEDLNNAAFHYPAYESSLHHHKEKLFHKCIRYITLNSPWRTLNSASGSPAFANSFRIVGIPEYRFSTTCKTSSIFARAAFLASGRTLPSI